MLFLHASDASERPLQPVNCLLTYSSSKEGYGDDRLGKENLAKLDSYRYSGHSVGRCPELVGGGLIKSQGGWSAVKAMHRIGVREKLDKHKSS
ncbi:MAG: hypothetical protein IMF11_03225 [Proteobacteria bacterium]|nr:hypothetical protein [Pseudomonadota bacterium]